MNVHVVKRSCPDLGTPLIHQLKVILFIVSFCVASSVLYILLGAVPLKADLIADNRLTEGGVVAAEDSAGAPLAPRKGFINATSVNISPITRPLILSGSRSSSNVLYAATSALTDAPATNSAAPVSGTHGESP